MGWSDSVDRRNQGGLRAGQTTDPRERTPTAPPLKGVDSFAGIIARLLVALPFFLLPRQSRCRELR